MYQDNRIEINGVWYVREDVVDKQVEDFELVFSLQAMYEDDKYCWEATRLMKDDRNSYYPDIDIKFTDKRVKPWKEEYWDGNGWLNNVLTNDSDAIKGAKESMCDNGIKTFKIFLNKLKEEGWLK